MLVLGLVLLSYIGTTIRGSQNVILMVDKVEVHYTNNVDSLIRSSTTPNRSSAVVSNKMPSTSSAAKVDAAQPRKYRLRRNTAITSPATNHTNHTNPKRTLYLHIGPLKTGTTTIQDIMRQTKIQNAAQVDGIALLSTFEQPIEECFTKLREDLCATKTRPGSCMARTNKMYETCETTLRDYFEAQDASAVFLSHEILGSTAMKGKYWGMLMSVLEENWDIRIVLGYRRYYEWKRSMANQAFKFHWFKEKENEFLEDSLSSIPNLFASEKFEWESPQQKFEFYGDTNPSGIFGVINLHDPDHTQQQHVAERVFCQIVENAPHLCQAIRSYVKRSQENNLERLQQNPSQAIACRSIALAAVHHGAVSRPMNRNQNWYTPHVKEVRCYVDLQASAMGYDCENDLDLLTKLPRVCLSSSQKEAILNRTLRDEASTLPEFFRSPEGEIALRKEFADAEKKGKFCSVDTAAILADKKWKEIFAGFDPEESYCSS